MEEGTNLFLTENRTRSSGYKLQERFWLDIRKKIPDSKFSSAVESTAKGNGGLYITRNLWTEALQRPAWDAVGRFPVVVGLDDHLGSFQLLLSLELVEKGTLVVFLWFYDICHT